LLFISANNCHVPENPLATSQNTAEPDEDIRDSLSASADVDILFPLSQAVLRLLERVSNTAESLPNGLSQRLLEALQASEILWKAPFARHKMVFKCDPDIVVKVVRTLGDYTEYTTLQYLQQHKPSIPAPRPLGCVQMGRISLIFMTHKPQMTLGQIWRGLDLDQKASVGEQLNAILTDLRSLQFTEGSPLGGVAGEGCKDVRRHLRRSENPIKTPSDFEDFLFSSPRPGGHVFVEFLHRLAPSLQAPSTPKIVFTHGDLRKENITVQMIDGNRCIVTGLLDWEYSGFYPDYYEAVRCTNCLAPYEDDDWYLFLPECISSKNYAHWWLLDRVRETRVV
jgi:hypothetical protein